MAESIIEHLSELTNQVDHFFGCIKQGYSYPDEYRKIIISKFDFFLIDSTDFEPLNENETKELNKLLNKINAIIKNEAATAKIVSYIFAPVAEHGYHYKIKADFSAKLLYYKTRLEEFITNQTVAQSIPIIDKQPEVKYIFKSNIARKLANFEFYGVELFDDDYDILLKNINLFISNKSKEISPELNFKAKYDYIAYYIINEILPFIKSDFELDPRVKINGKPYSTKARSESITKIFNIKAKSPKKAKLIKSLIDTVADLIKNNIMPG